MIEMRQWEYDNLKKVQEALLNSLLLAESMIVQLEAVCPGMDLPGDYPMNGLATIQETIRLHGKYENMTP